MSVANGRKPLDGILGPSSVVPVDRRAATAARPDPQWSLKMTDEHDTVVVHDDGGSSMGAILGVIAIIVLLAAVWYFGLGPGASSTATKNNGSGGSGSGDQPAASVEVPNPAGS